MHKKIKNILTNGESVNGKKQIINYFKSMGRITIKKENDITEKMIDGWVISRDIIGKEESRRSFSNIKNINNTGINGGIIINNHA